MPLMVDQLVDILKIIDKASSVLKVINVPKIFLDSTPQRGVLHAPQQVDMPKPLLNKDELWDAYHDAEGFLWFSLVGTRKVYWWAWGTDHTQWTPRGLHPRGCHRQARAVYKYWPRMSSGMTTVVHVLVIMQLEFQQPKLYEYLEMPQFQFFDRVVRIPVVC